MSIVKPPLISNKSPILYSNSESLKDLDILLSSGDEWTDSSPRAFITHLCCRNAAILSVIPSSVHTQAIYPKERLIDKLTNLKFIRKALFDVLDTDKQLVIYEPSFSLHSLRFKTDLSNQSTGNPTSLKELIIRKHSA